MKEYFEKAVKNIAKYGDTDIFPFPFERYMFEEKHESTVKLLEAIHSNFDSSLSSEPPSTIEEMVPVGYFGFRKATMIEPFWNAYFLGLVISLAESIELKRIHETENIVFSYRYEWNEEKSSLFKNITWLDYKKQCVENSMNCKYVVQTDIADFYPRINHHKLENELKRVDNESSNTANRIMKVLSSLTKTISYGLPVGGPASRILAELALRHVDEHLISNNIKFCRYVDDYTIFCDSESEAYKQILFLTQKLANDQLSLQKTKTKIMPSDEFLDIHKYLSPSAQDDSTDEQKLLNISIRFDPYSNTSQEDYESTKSAISEIDIIGILSKEINKTRVDQIVTKQAISAIKVLDTTKQLEAVQVLLDEKNLVTLTPVFTTILRAFRGIYDNLPKEGQQKIDDTLLNLFDNDHYLIRVNLNISYMIQLLSINKSQKKIRFFTRKFESSKDQFIKRQIIIAMSNWNCDYWLSDRKSDFNSSSVWERRAIIYSSYYLNDEGNHWRRNNKKSFTSQENLLKDWFSERKQSQKKVLS